MSYLDVPRFHFSGTFKANPSTINNTAANYNPRIKNPVPSWNPDGNHYWQFKNCAVTSAVDDAGNVNTTSAQGAVIGPAWADEPPNFVIGRLLRPSQSGPPVYYALTRDMSRDKRQLIIDWLDQGAPGPTS